MMMFLVKHFEFASCMKSNINKVAMPCQKNEVISIIICIFLSPCFAKMTINASNARPLGQQLVALTSRAALFTDVMDVIFVTHLVERLTRLAEKHRDVGTHTTHTHTHKSPSQKQNHI